MGIPGLYKVPGTELTELSVIAKRHLALRTDDVQYTGVLHCPVQ